MHHRRPPSLIALLMFAALGSLIAGCGQTDGPGSEATEPVAAEASAADEPIGEPTGAEGADAHELGLLVSVSELRDRLDDESLRLLDARARNEYDEAHIPGAVHVDTGDWRTQALADGGLHDAEAWAERVGRLGIDSQTPVVVYAENPTDATRIWWTLKYLGVEDAAVLDGGWTLWTEAEGETSSDEPDVAPVSFTPQFQPERLAEIGDLKASLESDDLVVVDTRSDEEYTGTGGPGARLGRVPGAVHLEWKELLDEKGRFKPKGELRNLFEARGISDDKRAVTYCQSGGRASLDAFALELAGYSNIQNYYCSWQEWSADQDAPVETD